MEGVLVQIAETTSLILVLFAFFVITALAVRVKTIRSLQFQIFLFALVLVLSEVPRILDTLGVIELGSEYGGSSPIGTIGLGLHTVSMIILSGFIMYRTYKFLKL